LVKVRTRTHGLHIGRVAGLTADTLYLRPERGSNAVELAAVRDVWVRGTATKDGALLGGVLGGALGAGLAALMSVGVCDAAECSVDAEVTVSGMLVGVATGAVTGAVIGAMFGKWHRKFP
jgi:hypothetical protein